MKNLTSPTAILMLSVGVVLDLIGLTIFVLGTWVAIDDYGILDMIGLSIIGLWLFIKHQSSAPSQATLKEDLNEIREQKVDLDELNEGNERPRTLERKKKEGSKNPKNIIKSEGKELAKKVLKRFGLAFLIELIPVVGGFTPAWTWLVYKNLD
jgi:hypothetical protein